ncbi:MAG: hypothetical protein ACI4QJ_04425 [Candidatus Spyradenecus sp.]
MPKHTPTQRIRPIDRFLRSPRQGISPLACPHCRRAMGYIDRLPKGRFQVRCATCRTTGPIEADVQKAVQKWNQIARS